MNAPATLSYVAAALAGGLSLVALRGVRRSPAKAAFALGMAALAFEHGMGGLSQAATLLADVRAWQQWRLLGLAIQPFIWLVFSLTYARGNYRDFLRLWRLPLALAAILPLVAIGAGWNQFFAEIYPPDNGTGARLLLNPPAAALYVIVLIATVGILMNLERTLRAAVGTMRWRIKFMIIGLGLLLGVRIYTATQALLYSMIDTTVQTLNAGAVILGGLLIARALYRSMLIETDIYVSQSVLFRSVTVLMAGAYLLLVGLLARLLTYLGTIAGFPVKALLVFLVLAGLAVLLASDRVRQASRRFVGRHFHRPLYDYRQVWESFTRRTALLTDLPAFGQEVARVVSETFEALAVTIWQFDDTRGTLTFVGSTAIPTALAHGPAGPEEASLLNALREMDKPVDMDAGEHPELAALKACNPMVFPDKGGHRIAVPLASGTERLGVMVLGDRVNGLPYTPEELELLRTIGAQIAAHLLNLKLAQQVLEAKQIEAFQTMSAFFVHDLKNTASTLSLMLQNMPRHYADPQFREDALKGIAASADRINEIIRRLTLLRQQDLSIKPVLADFNALVRQTVAPMQAHAAQHAWVLELGPLPSVALDPAQVQKVITNLLLNARDATPPGGVIRVQTEIRDPWVVLTVADSGCGMSREFMARDLFRPFQSRKKDGMGIGLFHTKMIVAAHRGKIEVESLEGQGSTFRVLLPLTSSEVAP